MARVGDKFILSGMHSTAGTSMKSIRHADMIMSVLKGDEADLNGDVLTGLIPAAELLQLRSRNWAWAMNYSELVLIEQTSRKGFIRLRGLN